MAQYTLHCFLESGNAYKAALMLTLCGAEWRPAWVDFFNGATRRPEFRAINELGEVPVLVDHGQDDLVITQSGVILLHLARAFGRFGPQSAADEREILRWMFWDNHKLTSYIATYRFLVRFMKKEGAEVEFLRGRAFSAIKLLDSHLQDRDWIACDRATAADISACGYLFWPDQFGADWNDYPGIAAWLSRVQALDGWAPPEALLPSAPVERRRPENHKEI